MEKRVNAPRDEGVAGDRPRAVRRYGRSAMGIYTNDGRILPATLWLLEDTDFYDY